MNHETSTNRLEVYAHAALDGILSELASGSDSRNNALNRAAHAAGRLDARGLFPDAERVLTEQGRAMGLDPAEVRATVRSGLRAGRRRPRRLPDELEDALRGTAPTPRRAPELVPDPEPVYMTADARRLWTACQGVTADAEVSAYLASRSIDPGEVVRLDLARALPHDYRPAYTIHNPDGGVPRTWAETGHRLIVPMHDHQGELRAVLARDVTGTSARKSTVRGPRRGLVLASSVGWIMLVEGRAPIGRVGPLEVVIAEGEIDFLTVAVGPERGAGWARHPAVLGIAAGSWTDEIATRVPDGAIVTIATDPDVAGERYAQKIAASLISRCDVRRWEAA